MAMSEKTRQMLDQIDTFLAAGDDDAADLEAVLTALRGPDFGGMDKRTMTIPIRRAALPECAHEYDTWAGLPNKLNSAFGDASYRFQKPDLSTIEADKYHFAEHAVRAASALGLIQ